MAEAYLAAEFSRQVAAGLAMPMPAPQAAATPAPDPRSQEVANENAQNLKGLLGTVGNLAGVGRKK